MQVSVETTQGLERRLTISVPAEKIDSEVSKRLVQLSKTQRIAGFRPGKVPVSVIEKRYGQAVRQEVAMDVMQRNYVEAVIAEKLNPAGSPAFAPKALNKGQDFEFTATFEVYPSVALNDVAALEVEQVKAEVTDEDLAKMLETLRKQHATWQDVDAAAANGHRINMNFVGKIDGEAFDGGKADNFPLELGQGRMIPGFEDGIIGKKAGETFTIDVTFPAEYHAENLKGKAAQFDITLNKVEEQVLPEVNEAFAALFGVAEGGVDALKVEVRKNMERELGQAVKSQVKAQVIKGLLAANEVELPQALVNAEIDNLRQQSLQRFGGNAKNMPELPAELFAEQAKDRVRTGLLLGEVIRTEEIKVDDARVKALIETVASAYENPAEVVEHYAKNPELMQHMRNVALEEQAIDAIIAKAKVTEKVASFDEIMNPKAAAE